MVIWETEVLMQSERIQQLLQEAQERGIDVELLLENILYVDRDNGEVHAAIDGIRSDHDRLQAGRRVRPFLELQFGPLPDTDQYPGENRGHVLTDAD